MSHTDPNVHVAVETDAIAGLHSGLESRRLAYVVQKNAPRERWRGSSRQLLDHQPRVDPDVAFGVKLRRLFHPFQCRDFGENCLKQACLLEYLESPPRCSLCEQLRQFITHAFRRNLCDLASMPAYGPERGRLNDEPEASGKARRPQQA